MEVLRAAEVAAGGGGSDGSGAGLEVVGSGGGAGVSLTLSRSSRHVVVLVSGLPCNNFLKLLMFTSPWRGICHMWEKGREVSAVNRRRHVPAPLLPHPRHCHSLAGTVTLGYTFVLTVAIPARVRNSRKVNCPRRAGAASVWPQRCPRRPAYTTTPAALQGSGGSAWGRHVGEGVWG
ncbi:hypothetical protein E2C01_009394 [Portunus trituberculatus]|uniref:Uncharacterized protein n=1 Tax=Portunus trituberculatus TaxID=210409 RepID=A0A5B7D512_PORTR|nr:hypothetical protein [Portunus trituberculatus]